VTDTNNGAGRRPQLAYSQTQRKMHDEGTRRRKAEKIIRVLHHYLGRSDLSGLSTLDIGCSTGFTASELASDGAISTGVDIDVPGLSAAEQRFGGQVRFICTSAESIPLPDGSLDVVVLNHIYEHVVDARAVVREIHRLLKPDGVAYLGLGNKYQIVEPHYGLPLLSWLPHNIADVYIKLSGRAPEYYERHESRAGLKNLLRGFHVYDYTVPIVRNPQLFGSDDQVGTFASRLPVHVVQALTPLVPTYVWIATKHCQEPLGTRQAEGLRHYDLTIEVPRPPGSG
jgi:SAM-dependent methyltransferase